MSEVKAPELTAPWSVPSLVACSSSPPGSTQHDFALLPTRVGHRLFLAYLTGGDQVVFLDEKLCHRRTLDVAVDLATACGISWSPSNGLLAVAYEAQTTRRGRNFVTILRPVDPDDVKIGKSAVDGPWTCVCAFWVPFKPTALNWADHERLLVGGSGSLCCWAVQPALVEPEESDTPSRAPSHDPSSPGQLFSPSTSDLNLRSSPLLLPRGSVSSNKRPAHPEVYKESEHILVDAHAHVEVALWSLTVAGLVADICSSASSYYHAIVCELPGRTVVHVISDRGCAYTLNARLQSNKMLSVSDFHPPMWTLPHPANVSSLQWMDSTRVAFSTALRGGGASTPFRGQRRRHSVSTTVNLVEDQQSPDVLASLATDGTVRIWTCVDSQVLAQQWTLPTSPLRSGPSTQAPAPTQTSSASDSVTTLPAASVGVLNSSSSRRVGVSLHPALAQQYTAASPPTSPQPNGDSRKKGSSSSSSGDRGVWYVALELRTANVSASAPSRSTTTPATTQSYFNSTRTQLGVRVVRRDDDSGVVRGQDNATSSGFVTSLFTGFSWVTPSLEHAKEEALDKEIREHLAHVRGRSMQRATFSSIDHQWLVTNEIASDTGSNSGNHTSSAGQLTVWRIEGLAKVPYSHASAVAVSVVPFPQYYVPRAPAQHDAKTASGRPSPAVWSSSLTIANFAVNTQDKQFFLEQRSFPYTPSNPISFPSSMRLFTLTSDQMMATHGVFIGPDAANALEPCSSLLALTGPIGSTSQPDLAALPAVASHYMLPLFASLGADGKASVWHVSPNAIMEDSHMPLQFRARFSRPELHGDSYRAIAWAPIRTPMLFCATNELVDVFCLGYMRYGPADSQRKPTSCWHHMSQFQLPQPQSTHDTHNVLGLHVIAHGYPKEHAAVANAMGMSLESDTVPNADLGDAPWPPCTVTVSTTNSCMVWRWAPAALSDAKLSSPSASPTSSDAASPKPGMQQRRASIPRAERLRRRRAKVMGAQGTATFLGQYEVQGLVTATFAFAHCVAPYFFVLVGCASGEVLVLEGEANRDANDPDSAVLTQLSSFEVDDSVIQVGALYINRVIVATQDNITMWECESLGHRFHMEHQVSTSDPTGFSLVDVGDGNLRVAIAQPIADEVDENAPHDDDEPAWSDYGAILQLYGPEIMTDAHKLTGDQYWHSKWYAVPGKRTKGCRLAAHSSAGGFLWLSPQLGTTKATCAPLASWMSIFRVCHTLPRVKKARDDRGPRLVLPPALSEGSFVHTQRAVMLHYHPHRLIENIMAGSFDRVAHSLVFLHQQLCRPNSDTVDLSNVDLLLPLQYLLRPGPGQEEEEVKAAIEEPAADASNSGGFDMSAFGSFGAATVASPSGGFDLSGFGNYGGTSSSPTAEETKTAIPEMTAYKFPFELQLTQEQGYELSDFLVKHKLPFLTPLQNLQVLAVVSTMMKVEQNRNNVDAFGLRFLASVNMFNVLHHTAPAAERTLSHMQVSWALHTSTQDAVLQAALSDENVSRELRSIGRRNSRVSIDDVNGVSQSSSTVSSLALGLTWDRCRAYGVGYWLRDRLVLVKLMTDLARQQYLRNKSPNDCMLLYLALGKKQILLGLLKSDEKLHKVWVFMSNNFTQARWRKAALANAFRAVQQKRWQVAAAFFVLGGSLQDALTICIREMKDFQLALVLARLVEGDESDAYKDVLEKLLEHSKEIKDPWLMHIALFLLDRKNESIRALLPSHAEVFSSKMKDLGGQSSGRFHPVVMSFLRLLCTPNANRPPSTATGASSALGGYNPFAGSGSTQSVVLDVDRGILRCARLQAAHYYATSGAAALALEYLPCTSPILIADEELLQAAESPEPEEVSAPASGGLDMSSFGGFGGGGFGGGGGGFDMSSFGSFGAATIDDTPDTSTAPAQDVSPAADEKPKRDRLSADRRVAYQHLFQRMREGFKTAAFRQLAAQRIMFSRRVWGSNGDESEENDNDGKDPEADDKQDDKQNDFWSGSAAQSSNVITPADFAGDLEFLLKRTSQAHNHDDESIHFDCSPVHVDLGRSLRHLLRYTMTRRALHSHCALLGRSRQWHKVTRFIREEVKAVTVFVHCEAARVVRLRVERLLANPNQHSTVQQLDASLSGYERSLQTALASALYWQRVYSELRRDMLQIITTADKAVSKAFAYQFSTGAALLNSITRSLLFLYGISSECWAHVVVALELDSSPPATKGRIKRVGSDIRNTVLFTDDVVEEKLSGYNAALYERHRVVQEVAEADTSFYSEADKLEMQRRRQEAVSREKQARNQVLLRMIRQPELFSAYKFGAYVGCMLWTQQLAEHVCHVPSTITAVPKLSKDMDADLVASVVKEKSSTMKVLREFCCAWADVLTSFSATIPPLYLDTVDQLAQARKQFAEREKQREREHYDRINDDERSDVGAEEDEIFQRQYFEWDPAREAFTQCPVDDELANALWHSTDVTKFCQTLAEDIMCLIENEYASSSCSPNSPITTVHGPGAVVSGTGDSTSAQSESKSGDDAAEQKAQDAQTAKTAAAQFDRLFHTPVHVFKSGDKNALPRTFVLNHVDHRYLAIATERGIREINMESSLRFRLRSKDRALLVDADFSNWEGCLHRFDHLEQRAPTPYDSHLYPVPLFRVIAIIGRSISSLSQVPTTKKQARGRGLTDRSKSLADLRGYGSTATGPSTRANTKTYSSVYRQFTEVASVAMKAGGLVIDREQVVVAMDSHPSLPLYVAATMTGDLFVYRFGWSHALAVFTIPADLLAAAGNDKRSGTYRVSRIRFTDTGHKLGVLLYTGHLLLYSFCFGHGNGSVRPKVSGDVDVDAVVSRSSASLPIPPFQVLHAHKVGLDFCFLNGGSIVALSGEASDSKSHVAVFDTLLSPLVARPSPSSPEELAANLASIQEEPLFVYSLPDASAVSAVCHIPASQLLVAGSVKGSLYVLDLEWGHVLVHRIDNVHSGPVVVLCYDPVAHQFLSGGQDGMLKRWNASSFKLRASTELYRSRTFFNHSACYDMVSSFGVTDAQVADSCIVACGADGTVTYIKRKLVV